MPAELDTRTEENLNAICAKLAVRGLLAHGMSVLIVLGARQELYRTIWGAKGVSNVHVYPVSTGKPNPPLFNTGFSEVGGSFQTPRGAHRIREKARDHELGEEFGPRIMKLDGLECGGPDWDYDNRNSFEPRHIWIHGTNEEHRIGQKTSKGCIRLRNDDLIKLFDTVPIGTLVYIAENG